MLISICVDVASLCIDLHRGAPNLNGFASISRRFQSICIDFAVFRSRIGLHRFMTICIGLYRSVPLCIDLCRSCTDLHRFALTCTDIASICIDLASVWVSLHWSCIDLHRFANKGNQRTSERTRNKLIIDEWASLLRDKCRSISINDSHENWFISIRFGNRFLTWGWRGGGLLCFIHPIPQSGKFRSMGPRPPPQKRSRQWLRSWEGGLK